MTIWTPERIEALRRQAQQIRDTLDATANQQAAAALATEQQRQAERARQAALAADQLLLTAEQEPVNYDPHQTDPEIDPALGL